MGVDYFSCQNCGDAVSEYDKVYCEKCESELCSCAMPKEISKLCNCWEDVWEYIATDNEDNIRQNVNCSEDYSELFKKYLAYDSDTYGLELKEEFCPICQRRKEMEKDPEYKEYLRLKAKFDKF